MMADQHELSPQHSLRLQVVGRRLAVVVRETWQMERTQMARADRESQGNYSWKERLSVEYQTVPHRQHEIESIER